MAPVAVSFVACVPYMHYTVTDLQLHLSLSLDNFSYFPSCAQGVFHASECRGMQREKLLCAFTACGRDARRRPCPCRMNSSAPKSSMHFMARLFPPQLRAREHYRSMLILIALPSSLPPTYIQGDCVAHLPHWLTYG